MDLSIHQPAIAAPPGQYSNLLDPPSQAYLLVITVVISLVCVTPMVAIRMYVSMFVLSLRWDDGLVFISWLLLIVYCGIGLSMIQYGALVDIWNVSLGDYVKWRRLIYFEELVYSILIFSIRLSVLVLYKRVFLPARTKRTWIHYTIMTVIAFNVMYYTVNTLVDIFACTPIHKVWDQSVSGTCLNTTALVVSAAAINVFSDFFVLFIPVAVVRNLRMPRKRKLEIACIFACGIFIVRLVYSVIDARTPNQTVALMRVAMWTIAEETSCFLASCVPMVPRFMRHICHPDCRQKKHLPSTQDMVENLRVKKCAAKKPSPWSMPSSLQETESDEEDPYLMTEEPSRRDLEHPCLMRVETGMSTRAQTPIEAVADNDILVTRTFDISLVPQSYTERYHTRPYEF